MTKKLGSFNEDQSDRGKKSEGQRGEEIQESKQNEGGT